MAPSGAFAAKFVEVRVDRDLGLIRIARHRLGRRRRAGSSTRSSPAARSSAAPSAGSVRPSSRRRSTTTRAGSRMRPSATTSCPVNADVPDIDVVFVGEPDRLTPTGTRESARSASLGIAPAIANAIYHATGRRIARCPSRSISLL